MAQRESLGAEQGHFLLRNFSGAELIQQSGPVGLGTILEDVTELRSQRGCWTSVRRVEPTAPEPSAASRLLRVPLCGSERGA